MQIPTNPSPWSLPLGKAKPTLAQDKQALSYDENYDVPFTADSVEKIELIDYTHKTIHITLYTGIYLKYDPEDDLYSHFEFRRQGGQARAATSKERETFVKIASNKLRNNPDAKELLLQMNAEQKKLQSTGVLQPTYFSSMEDMYFEVPDQNIRVFASTRKGSDFPYMDIERYTTPPKGQRAPMNAFELDPVWEKISAGVDRPPYAKEIAKYLPKLMANLDKQNPNYDKILLLLNQVGNNLLQYLSEEDRKNLQQHLHLK